MGVFHAGQQIDLLAPAQIALSPPDLRGIKVCMHLYVMFALLLVK